MQCTATNHTNGGNLKNDGDNKPVVLRKEINIITENEA